MKEHGRMHHYKCYFKLIVGTVFPDTCHSPGPGTQDCKDGHGSALGACSPLENRGPGGKRTDRDYGSVPFPCKDKAAASGGEEAPEDQERPLSEPDFSGEVLG